MALQIARQLSADVPMGSTRLQLIAGHPVVELTMEDVRALRNVCTSFLEGVDVTTEDMQTQEQREAASILDNVEHQLDRAKRERDRLARVLADARVTVGTVRSILDGNT